jgi:hypothetical protein
MMRFINLEGVVSLDAHESLMSGHASPGVGATHVRCLESSIILEYISLLALNMKGMDCLHVLGLIH